MAAIIGGKRKSGAGPAELRAGTFSLPFPAAGPSVWQLEDFTGEVHIKNLSQGHHRPPWYVPKRNAAPFTGSVKMPVAVEE